MAAAMTPTEFAHLTTVWPSLSAAAVDLRITRQSAYRYRDGDRPVPDTVARLLRILHAHPELRAA